MKDKIKGKEKYLKRTEFPKVGTKAKRMFQFDPSKDRSPILTKELSEAFDAKRYEEGQKRKDARLDKARAKQ